MAPSVDFLEPRCLLASKLPTGDIVLKWNAIALKAVAADYDGNHTPEQAGPTRTSRALAIVQTAVFDAANAIRRRFTPYLLKQPGPAAASVKAAVAQAAHDALIAMYPNQRARFDLALRQSLAFVPNGRSELQGVTVGRLAAKVILRDRFNDGSQFDPPYIGNDERGVYLTFPGEMAALTPAWGAVKPFGMSSADAFMPPPPPELTSVEYAAAYDEVKRLGGDGVTTSTERTREQTFIGLFWAYDGTPGIGTPPRFFNQIAQVVARRQKNTIMQNARMFALVNMALADAGCAGWASKYTYNLWRPIRGIQQVGPNGESLDDGNTLTEADPNWNALGAPCTNCPPGKTPFTPPFPAYVSGHATFGAALFQILARFYGRDDIHFTVVSDELNGKSTNPDGSVRPLVPRTFSSFSEAMEENGQSRIYLGIHWSFDKELGISQGKAIANFTYARLLTPLSKAAEKRFARA